MNINQAIEYYKLNKDQFKEDYSVEDEYLYDEWIEDFFNKQ